ncbi:hypothetical protein [Streptomyces sp. YU58]|uniref:hypothetical protein n=1 Tax=Streptomyces sp. SX92 TaxID=3158972 RepID=UPI0027B87D2A|nr:hypothetical protein [Streptomyces coralus]WLW51648.1 hypothetical protein QU709_09825 [Streptomyces coralus]
MLLGTVGRPYRLFPCLAPPSVADEFKEFRERLEADVRRPGFRALVARSADGGVDGFVTGWITQAPFRTDRAYPKVTAALGRTGSTGCWSGPSRSMNWACGSGSAAPVSVAGCCPASPRRLPAAGSG